MDVLLNCPLTQSQVASDFFISQAATDQERDLVLTRAQKLRPVVHKARLVEKHRTHSLPSAKGHTNTLKQLGEFAQLRKRTKKKV